MRPPGSGSFPAARSHAMQFSMAGLSLIADSSIHTTGERLLVPSTRHQAREMIENRSAPPGPLVPGRFYDDIAAAIEWICSAFAFTEIYRYGTPDRPQGAFLSTGNGGSVAL